MSNETLLQEIKQSILNTAPDSEVLYMPELVNDPEVQRSFRFIIIVKDDKIDWKKENKITDPLYDLEIKSGVALSFKVISQQNWQNKLSNTPAFHEIQNTAYRLL